MLLSLYILQSHSAYINSTQITQQWMMVNLALMIINEVVIAKSLIIHIIFRLIFSTFTPLHSVEGI